MRAVIVSLLLVALSPMAAAQRSAALPVIAVVCPQEYRAEMRPWVERRSGQNRVEFVADTGSAEQIRARIRSLSKKAKVQAIVIVGDAPPTLLSAATKPANQTPTFFLPGKVNLYWGGSAEFASDNPYADFDDDGVPDVAIGRLPADSARELAAMIRKILAYEDNRNFGPWRSQINLVAGEGGFGPVVDGVIEAAARRFITWGVPAAYRSTMTYANWQSPYCPDPRHLHECSLERINEGCLFWVYIGHGSPRRVKPADFPDGPQPILSWEDCPRLNCGNAPPIAMFLACHIGSFAAPSDCLAEDLLRAAGGPVAVISGSNVTMPYAMSALGREAMREFFDGRRETVGELLLHAKRGMCRGDGVPFWSAIHALTVAAAPASLQPKEERREHLQLFNLFGDPTMKVRIPQTAKITAPKTASAGQWIRIASDSPMDGKAEIELVVRRDHFRRAPNERSAYRMGDAARAEFEATYREANDPRLASAKLDVCKGRFETEIAVPADASGPCHVRVFIEGTDDCAVGASDILIGNEKQ
ncbi:MAG: hypothetical protein IT427_10985 [Pirellulales bacterium]|nr:hypothetical protein [Pirellulales bacterium]